MPVNYCLVKLLCKGHNITCEDCNVSFCSCLNTHCCCQPQVMPRVQFDIVNCSNCDYFGYPCLNCERRICNDCNPFTCKEHLLERPDKKPNPLFTSKNMHRRERQRIRNQLRRSIKKKKISGFLLSINEIVNLKKNW